jgi:hypothetical protein
MMLHGIEQIAAGTSQQDTMTLLQLSLQRQALREAIIVLSATQPRLELVR